MPTTIKTGRSPYWPPTFANTPEGYLFVANGLDDMIRVNRLSDSETLAGIIGPTAALSFTFADTGTIDGVYYAWYRYVDADGIPSNLSPISAAVTADDDGRVDYTGLVASANSRVTTIEVFRTTAGQQTVAFRDVSVANGVTTASSTKTDDDLTDEDNATYLELPIHTHAGRLHANRFVPPPYHKAVVVQHQDRFWYFVDVTYSLGNIQVTNGSTTVTGIGTGWTSNMAGRDLYVGQRAGVHRIASVNVANQTLTLSAAYTGNSGIFGYYAITPPISERNALYWSYPGEPESVPSQNSVVVADIAEDEGTGLMPLGKFLFLLFSRHIYRFSYQLSPNDDYNVSKTVSRGCVNQRCWVRVEDVVYMLDREGMHVFQGGHDGGRTEHISEQIQDYFRDGRIRWTEQRWFFVSHSPTEEVVRFHVSLGEAYLPRHALCYQYRHNAWFLETYPYGLGGWCLALVADAQRCILGGQYERHYLQGEGTLDGVQFAETGDATIRGTVDSATLYTITDSSATYPTTGLINAPLHFISGRAKGRSARLVAVNGTTLAFRDPLAIKPDVGDVYQIGGVPWRMIAGTYQFAQQDERYAQRRVRVVAEPTESECVIDLSLTYDHDSSPASDYVSYTGGDGVQTAQDSEFISLPLIRRPGDPREGEFNGYHHVDISKQQGDPRYSDNWITPELSGVQGRDPVILYQFGMDGVR